MTDGVTDGVPLGRDSVLWRVATEPALLVPSGPRALLLQVAHPLVAAGVEQHSDYERHPWQRLIRTLDVMLAITFASPAHSEQMVRLLRGRHREVTGVAADGTPYRALDPELLCWVWATLAETTVVAYERLVRRLADDERAQLYEEWKQIGVATGVPPSRLPATWEDFTTYVKEVEAQQLRATPTTRAVADQILHPPLPRPIGPLAGRLLAALAAPLLPAELADELAFRSPLSPAVTDRLARTSQTAARAVPGWLRRLPLRLLIGLRLRPAVSRLVVRFAYTR